MFSGSSQLTTTAEHCFVVWTGLNDFIIAPSAVVGIWEEPPDIWLMVAKTAFVGWALNYFRVHMLLKGAVKDFKISWTVRISDYEVFFEDLGIFFKVEIFCDLFGGRKISAGQYTVFEDQ